MVTVYLDVLFILDLAVDWVLVQATAYMTRRFPPRRRIFTAAAIGAALACVRAALTLPAWFDPVYTAVTAMCICALAFGPASLRELMVVSGLFWGLSCLFAGLMTAFLQLGGAKTGLPLMVFILSGLAFYLLSGLFSGLTGAVREAPATLTVTIGDASAALPALRDSGHSLRDPLTNREAAIVRWDAVRALFSSPVRGILDAHPEPMAALGALGEAQLSRGFSLLPCRTVQGSGMLLGYSRAGVAIDGEHAALTLAITHEVLSDTGTFQAIIRA